MKKSSRFSRLCATLLPSFALLSSSYALPSHRTRSTVNDWASIEPSPDLKWTPCFDNFTCARLQVPLDYGDPSRGTTAIAFIKLAAENVTQNTQNLLINQGGSGGPGVELVLHAGSSMAEALGSQHNIVGFDPRGVGQSGPVVDCWPNHPEKRAQFEKLFYPGVSHASSTALDRQYYAAEIFGKACTENAGGPNGNASFISTPAVAHDLFTYINAEQKLAGKPLNESKISYFAVSYGTVLGATFASLYPDHVGKMVLDGLVDASDYYSLGWRSNLYDSDEALDSFSKYCFQGGATNCSLWGPSVQNITVRLNVLLANLKYHPVPIPSSNACDIPLMATYSDLKEYILSAMYTPLSKFPVLADVLSDLERGNTSAYVTAVTDGSLPANPCNNGSGENGTTDVNTLIKCVDGYSGHKFENLTGYRNYVDTLTLQSRFFGEVWPNNANGILCRSFDAKPPKSGQLPGSILETLKTSFPILFVTAETDPVAPKRGACKMSSVFPGSVVLTQASVGHTALASVSSCHLKNVQNYLDGQLPAANTTCQPDVLPFQGSASLSFGR